MSGVLRSRKFWASIAGVVAVVVLQFSGADLPAEKLVDAILVLVSAFIGGTALEDGLKKNGA